MPRSTPQTPGIKARPEQPDDGTPVAIADKDSQDVEISGRPDSPPAAHGGGETSPSPPAWSYPSGLIAAREMRAAVRSEPLAAPATPSLGPEGRRRSPVMVVVLSIVTLGVYALIWHSRINTEVGDFDTRMYIRAGRSTLAVTIAWVIGLLTSLAGAAIIVTSQMQVTLPLNAQFTVVEEYLWLGGILLVPYLVLAIPFSMIAMVMTLERIRIAEDRAGRPTDAQLRPARTVWWLAVPIAGGLILETIMQRRLNQVWEVVAPKPAARISNF